MKRVIVSSSKLNRGSYKKRPVKASVDPSYFSQFDHVNGLHLPGTGEGTNMASQICTAVNKLVYKWYNDGDVYDNTYGMEGWANDLSSYANWLYKYVPKSRSILDGIVDIFRESEYEDLLRNLCDTLLDAEDLENYEAKPKVGSVYDCDGIFKFEDYTDEDEDEYYEDEDEDY